MVHFEDRSNSHMQEKNARYEICIQEHPDALMHSIGI